MCVHQLTCDVKQLYLDRFRVLLAHFEADVDDFHGYIMTSDESVMQHF